MTGAVVRRRSFQIILVVAVLSGCPPVGGAQLVEPKIGYSSTITCPHEIAYRIPERAMRLEIDGRATVSCKATKDRRLTDCSAVSERPTDQYFGVAATKMAAMCRLKSDPVDENSKIEVDFTFDTHWAR